MTKDWKHFQVRFGDVNGGLDKCVYRKAPNELTGIQWSTLDLAKEVGLSSAGSDWRLVGIAEVSEEHFAIAVARQTVDGVGTETGNEKEGRTMGLCDSEFGREFYLESAVTDFLSANGFADVSWHNDVCPHFDRQLRNGNHLEIWCDAIEREDSEMGLGFPNDEYFRFWINETDSNHDDLENEPMLLTNDWKEIEGFITNL